MMNKNDDNLIWKELNREKKADCKIFDYVNCRRVAPDGSEADITLLDSPDSVTVISIVKNEQGIDCFPMVRQFRHGTETVLMEFPAGLVDPGEKPVDAAVREFAEETGYSAGEVINLGSVCPNPAYLNNKNHTFLILNPEYKGLEKLDSGEFLEKILVPVEEVEKAIGEGEYANGMMMISYLYYLKWKEINT